MSGYNLKDLNSIAQTCKRLYPFLSPVLYRGHLSRRNITLPFSKHGLACLVELTLEEPGRYIISLLLRAARDSSLTWSLVRATEG